MWLAFALALSLSGPGDHQAEQLFRKMEVHLSEAKTLYLSFAIAFGEASPRSGRRAKGTLAATGGNRLRLEVKGGRANATVFLRLSDGARAILEAEGDEGRPKPGKTPKNLTANYQTAVARGGVLLAMHPQILVNERGDYKKVLRVSSFRLGNREKIGETEGQRIDYVLNVKGWKTPYSVAVWIDVKTGLPVKRVIWDGSLPFVTETYELRVNEKLNPRMFELPR